MNTKKPELKTPKLANKPSAVLHQAVADLKALERSKKYHIDMDNYHEPNQEEVNVCQVCFAGAVIARAGNAPTMSLTPDDFDSVTASKLRALDYFRIGAVSDGLEQFDLKKIPILLRTLDWTNVEIEVTPYEDDPIAFKKEMVELAKNLESLGL